MYIKLNNAHFYILTLLFKKGYDSVNDCNIPVLCILENNNIKNTRGPL